MTDKGNTFPPIRQKIHLTKVNKMIRQAFYDKRKMTISKEEVPESASILSITDIPDIVCSDNNLEYPNKNIVRRILDKDDNKEEIDLEKLSKEELLELVKTNPEAILNKQENNDESIELQMKEKKQYSNTFKCE